MNNDKNKFVKQLVCFLFAMSFLFVGCQKQSVQTAQPPTTQTNSAVVPQPTDAQEPQHTQASAPLPQPTVQQPNTLPPSMPNIPSMENVFIPMPKTTTATQPEHTVPEKPEPILETKPFWQSENTLQWNNLKSVATAAQHAYDDLYKKLGLISKNGKMYTYYTQKNITTDDLVSAGYLEGGLQATDYEILLLNGNDVMYYPGAEVPPKSMRFCVFVAAHQADDTYLLSTIDGKAGVLSAASYTALMQRYNQNHNMIGKLSSTSAEYSRIVNFIGLYEGKLEDYFVREISKDDKYAVVTFSGKQNTADIKQHILRNDNNFWEVVYTNLQNVYTPITSINQSLPDFNLELLPNYTLASWKSYLQKSNAALMDTLLSKKIINTPDQIDYQCGTSDYFYIVLTNGARYVAYFIDNTWQITHVNSDYEAKNFISARTNADYGFLILDD